MFYVEIFVLIAIWLIFGLSRHVDRKVYAIVPLMIMALVVGLRFETGRDLQNYRYIFYSIVLKNKTLNVEVSYVILSKILYKLGFDFQMLILVYSLLSYTFIYLTMIKLDLSKYEIMMFIVLFFAFGFSTFFIIMRQFLSASILLYGAIQGNKSIQEKRNKILLFALAISFHYAVLIVVIAYYLIELKIWNNRFVLFSSLLLAVFFSRSKYIIRIINSVSDRLGRYAYYLLKDNYGRFSGASKTMILFTLLFLGVLIIDYLNKTEFNNRDIIMKMSMLTLVIYYMSLALGWLHRSFWYTIMFLFLLPCWIEPCFKNKRVVYLVAMTVFSLYTISIYSRIGEVDSTMIPYKYSLQLLR